MRTRLYTLAEKKTIALIFTLVARLAKVQVKKKRRDSNVDRDERLCGD